MTPGEASEQKVVFAAYQGSPSRCLAVSAGKPVIDQRDAGFVFSHHQGGAAIRRGIDFYITLGSIHRSYALQLSFITHNGTTEMVVKKVAAKKTGGRKLGDKNHTLREERLIAENAKLKADVALQKAKANVKDARMKELRASLAAEKKRASAKK